MIQKIFRNFKVICVLTFFLVLIQRAGAEEAELSEAGTASETQTVQDTLMQMGNGMSLHKQNYLLPLTWGSNDSKLKDAELKFQLSLKQRLFDTDFYIAYTQKSFWRILDDADSRPFRETNYNPEIFYRLVPENNPLGNWGADIGYEHESNGSKELTSRSWDRLYIAPYYGYKKFRADLKFWYRIKEDTDEDDNPDIEDYLGHGEMKLWYEWTDNQMLTLIGRLNPGTGRGSMQLDYSRPGFRHNIFFFAQLWTGYGESLIDYNNYITAFGIGIMFKR
jgi:phospholipase A1/A2